MSATQMNFLILNYIGKADWISQAIKHAGHNFVKELDEADVLLIDTDTEVGQRRAYIDEAAAKGVLVVLYPHGGGANWILQWDGIWHPHPDVHEIWVQSTGQQYLLSKVRPSVKVRVIGHPWGPVRKPTKTKLLSVTLAPVHPPYCTDLWPNLNRAMFNMVRRWPIDHVTVRTIGTPEENGIPVENGVTYKAVGSPLTGSSYTLWEDQFADIDGSDLVVADAGTFGACALARGIPTILYASGVAVSDYGYIPVNERYIAHQKFISYPLDPCLQASSPSVEWNLAEQASEWVPDILAWRDNFIGHQLNLDAALAGLQASVLKNNVLHPERNGTSS